MNLEASATVRLVDVPSVKVCVVSVVVEVVDVNSALLGTWEYIHLTKTSSHAKPQDQCKDPTRLRPWKPSVLLFDRSRCQADLMIMMRELDMASCSVCVRIGMWTQDCEVTM